MAAVDFVVREDGLGLRYAYPVSLRGKHFFDRHIALFDLSEQGWELDTTENELREFRQLMIDMNLNFEEMQ